MLIDYITIAKWNSKNKNYYKSKGYVFTKYKDEFTVKVDDLSNSSSTKVQVKCDNCGEISIIRWVDYKKIVKTDNKTYCKSCAYKLYMGETVRKSKLKNGITFYQWCINNNRQDVLNLWDYKLNKLNPNQISHSTTIKCYFKCPCKIHESELKSINTITRNINNEVMCLQCNSFGQYLLNNYKKYGNNIYWSNKNTINPFEVSYGSKNKAWLICPNCGNEKFISPNEFIHKGISCSKCSDGISYSEKFIYSVLQQLNIDFQTQLNKTTFKWCKGENYEFKYDFYIPSLSLIIETHGRQHYEDCNRQGSRNLQKEQANDILKEKIAKENGIKNYIAIDCRKSEAYYIMNNIISSDLSNLFNLSQINYKICHEYACNSLVKITCDLWNSGINDTKTIANNLKLGRSTIIHYLKQGLELNWCNYNPQKEMIKGSISKSKKVYCIEMDKVFLSVNQAARELKINHGSISACCLGKIKSAGRHKITGEKLHWIFL